MMLAPSYDAVLESCIELVAKSRKLSPESIAPETSFEALGADSLDMINLSFEVEELFDVQIPDESLSSIHTVEDMARGVSALISAKTAASVEKPA
jgi:acyl carrier protein